MVFLEAEVCLFGRYGNCFFQYSKQSSILDYLKKSFSLLLFATTSAILLACNLPLQLLDAHICPCCSGQSLPICAQHENFRRTFNVIYYTNYDMSTIASFIKIVPYPKGES